MYEKNIRVVPLLDLAALPAPHAMGTLLYWRAVWYVIKYGPWALIGLGAGITIARVYLHWAIQYN